MNLFVLHQEQAVVYRPDPNGAVFAFYQGIDVAIAQQSGFIIKGLKTKPVKSRKAAVRTDPKIPAIILKQ